MTRRPACALLLLLALVAGSGRAEAAAAPVPVFRVFLKDGTALACWGEYARVGDRLVLTVPIGQGARTAYEFVSLPVSQVDLVKTELYAEGIRAAQFAASRGAAEYAALSDRLSAQLASIASLPDSNQRLAAAESARQQLIDWAALSHGYRAKEVQQMLQLFDSAIIDLRVAAGESRFSISLSAGIVPPPPPKLRAAPGLRETIRLALRAATVADSPAVRLALLRRARTAASSLPKDDVAAEALREAVASRLAAEVFVQNAYRQLDLVVRRQAARAVDAGDTRRIEALRAQVLVTDRRLGRRQPDDIEALLRALDDERDLAALQRLVLDGWEAMHADLQRYQEDVAGLIDGLNRLDAVLAAVRDMSGPGLTTLVRAERQTADMVSVYSAVIAPAPMAGVHGQLAQAIEAADLAVRTRHRAVSTRQLDAAREASAAASAALAHLAQAKAQLAVSLRPPRIPRQP